MYILKTELFIIFNKDLIAQYKLFFDNDNYQINEIHF